MPVFLPGVRGRTRKVECPSATARRLEGLLHPADQEASLELRQTESVRSTRRIPGGRSKRLSSSRGIQGCGSDMRPTDLARSREQPARVSPPPSRAVPSIRSLNPSYATTKKLEPSCLSARTILAD